MKKHMKRMAAPNTWAIPRKTSHWVTKPSPGPHGTREAMPLLAVVRDMLKLCDNAREARFIIGSRGVSVDGKIVTDYKYPVGLMDVVTILKTKQSYRMLVDYKSQLKLVSIDDSEKGWKLARIDGKKVIRKGKVQLNLHDGRCMILAKDQYKTGDVLKIDVPSQKLVKNFKLEKGSMALLIGGSHPGSVQTIENYQIRRGSAPNLVTFKEGFSTIKENVFVVGDKAPEIKLLEAKVA
ncbi:MAG: 30S ribosomal protein S4e [Euryarchaeota archaeon RBG_13_61_15]|jgi:small subunit ribosomal protein S4e|nr:MAG: 30S ribosomal protein S4e [Euryarchaeota archaeon RBG_13_61_15]